MKKIALISVILDEPTKTQSALNEIVSANKNMIRGRMGIPMDDVGVAAIALTVVGEMDEINSFTGKLGKLEKVNVKTAISTKEIK